MHSDAATEITTSGPTADVCSPSIASAATLSTKTQLTHRPAHKDIVHGMRAAGASHARAWARSYADAIFDFGELLLTDPRYAHQSSTEAKAPFFVRSSIID